MQFQFNARQFQPATADGGNPPLPVGEWPMQITSVEIKPTQNNDGGYIQCDIVIFDGPHRSAAGAVRYNLFNSNEQAVQIAQRQFSSLCHVTGVYDVNEGNLQSFVGKQFIGVVTKNKPTSKFPDGTNVTGVKDIQGNDPGKQQQTAQQAPVAPPVAAQPSQWAGQPAAPAPAGWTGNGAAQAPAPAAPPAAPWQPSGAAPSAAAPWQRPAQ